MLMESFKDFILQSFIKFLMDGIVKAKIKIDDI